ncbi:RNA-binding protein s1, putative [Plasmodium berghei]|uniref:RNA-binding protein s1, putative n=2 Tax=Plasmodium berghei TaxID=5821 RepID=A0A509ALZ1_PLABA|nr:RNA-binding protein s1, putative [Plasmodium berghei ANKA]CXI42209.1 RNA-binding protein s1, putative [Plasmodium berghei]SCM22063.1 RNA-binding protein s1, putative [Plasmodium berghei]SCN25256.1 RNA-binding protein s1, putative [Plasmodium berghei]SCO60240.1 RNA-binding protein s1, putative [Plasmodium berghei]SCO61887.1 RNA-binding protein s1, putative [Plasmodium berghei]|eukprot:XP_034421524.1 RNA-binding protein s1, putative [Plasmodium berghei ANKA]
MIDNCLYVYNLTKNTSVEHLKEIFMNFGKLIDINYVLNDDNLSKEENDNLVYAKIEFENPNDAKTAIEYMDGGQIDGKTISIKHEHEITSKNNNNRVSKERNEKDGSYKYSDSRSSSSNSSKNKSNTSQIKKKNKSKKKQKKYK